MMKKLIISLLSSFAVFAHAEPIQFVSPFLAGSSNDVLTRRVAMSIPGSTVENRPGASNTIAVHHVLFNAPEKVLVVGLANQFMVDFTDREIAKYQHTDLEFIKTIADITTSVVASNNAPPFTHPDSKNMFYGYASPSHVIALSMLSKHVPTNFIPFKAGPAAMLSVATNEVQYAFGPLASNIGLVKAGKIKLVAVGSAKRLPSMPLVPTMREINSNFFFTDSFVIAVTKNMDRARISVLKESFSVIDTQDYQSFLDNMYFEKPSAIEGLVEMHTRNRPLYKKYADLVVQK